MLTVFIIKSKYTTDEQLEIYLRRVNKKKE